MFYYKLCLVCLLILKAVNAALNKEDLVGGYPAFQPNHKYDAAIIGQYNRSDIRYLVCNGCIIGNFFVLSAYQCFFNKKTKEFKKISFALLVGSTKLTSTEPRAKEIYKIYTPGSNNDMFVTDLAVIKLKESLALKDNPNLISLEIPYSNQTYETSGTISGYGSETNDYAIQNPSRSQIQITETLGLNLTYAFVLAAKDEDCEKAHGNILKFYHICGVIRPDYRYQLRGICTGDIGTPLVIGNKIVGIAIIRNIDCDDTVKGSIYAKVSLYKKFIDAVVSENFENTGISPLVFYNNPHIKP